MQNHAFKINEFHQDSASPAAKWNKPSHLHLAVVTKQETAQDSQYGADLGEFEAQYLLGYSCFA